MANKSSGRWWIISGVVVVAISAAWMTQPRWRPWIAELVAPQAKPAASSKSAPHDDHSGHDHQGHDHSSHDHAGHDHAGHEGESGDGHGAETPETVIISDQARQNLALQVGVVEPQDFWKRITVPGQVANLPGQSERRINATVQGTVLKVHVVPGQTVRPGDALMEIQVTSELLATAQSNLLRILQDLELNAAEIERLTPISDSGISGKQLLEKQYEQRRLESARQVQLQELTVRGLTPAQVRSIIEQKSLIRQFTVKVPSPYSSQDEARHEPREPSTGSSRIRLASQENPASNESPASPPAVDEEPVFVIERMDVFPGRLVNPGDELCDLALHSKLQIRGEAFETESAQIYQALTERWPVTAIFDLGGPQPLAMDNLTILYASSETDPAARSFDFFIPLENEVIRDQTGADGRNYRSWRFKPGQQVQLRVPVEKWTDRFVVPADAVVNEGVESYVFKVNGKMLERQAVVVEFRDSREAVLANDGSLFPGDEIAFNQAYALNLALKKASGSGVDIHAGHNH